MKLYQLSLLFVCLACISLFVGVQDLSILQLFHLTDEQVHTLVSSRLPRLVSIVLAGMSLSLCGFIMQSMTRNKFVSPTTAGTMDWAKLGILVAMLVFTHANPLMKMGIAFLFTLAGNLLFLKNPAAYQGERYDLCTISRLNVWGDCQFNIYVYSL